MSEKARQFDVSLQFLVDVYEERIPFNKVIGMRIESLTAENTRARFMMKKKLVGNYIRGYFFRTGCFRRHHGLSRCHQENGREIS